MEKEVNICKSGIYKITNNLNNKCYIGSAINLCRRKNEHYGKSKRFLLGKDLFLKD